MNQVFFALADPTRREILQLLKRNDMTAGEISEHFQISKPSISHHLNILKQADLISAVRAGPYITYSINLSVLEETLVAYFNLFRKGENDSDKGGNDNEPVQD